MTSKRLTLDASRFQLGFSALPMFLAGLALLGLMSFTGFFNYPKSPVDDTNQYAPSNDPHSDTTSLQLIDLKFDQPTLPPTEPTATPTQGPTPTTGPTATPGPTSTPTPTPTSGPTPTSAPTPTPTLVPAG